MGMIAARLKARIPPPPLVMLLAGALGWFCSAIVPGGEVSLSGLPWVALLVVGVGLALNLYPKIQFRRVGTTVNPLAPHRSSVLVTSGVYRYTRNPMYLGHALILLGVAAYSANLFSLVAVPAYIWYVTAFQVMPEERALAAQFPAQFAMYASSTRRWV